MNPCSTSTKTISGLDLNAPGGLEALFAFHRNLFGEARMMADPPAGPPAPAPTPPAPPAPAPTPPAPPAPATPPPPPPADPAPGKVEDLPPWAQKIIKDARQEAGDNRTAKTAAEQQQQEMLDGIAKALGLKPADAPADPAALQQTLTQREARVADLEADGKAKDVELAAWRSASKQGANVVALLDSRSFLAQIAALDSAAADFTSQLDGAVKKALEDNPAMRASPVPTPGQAGIGATGNGSAATDSGPGLARLRQGYAETPK